MLNEKPLSTKFILLSPVVVGVSAGIGTALICGATGVPEPGVGPLSFGTGFIFASTMAIAAINAALGERKAYWEFRAKLAEAQIKPKQDPLVELGPMETSTGTWLKGLNGFTAGLASFQSITDEQLRGMAARVGNGQYSLAFNQLRPLGLSDRAITQFRRELCDRGYASEMARGNKTEVMLNKDGKRFFYDLCKHYFGKRLPSPSRKVLATA